MEGYVEGMNDPLTHEWHLEMIEARGHLYGAARHLIQTPPEQRNCDAIKIILDAACEVGMDEYRKGRLC